MESQDSTEIKKEVNSQVHKHLSTIFIVVGIVSFTLGAIVNYYTIRRLNGQK
jgi:vacuolar-type H+-ATPase subunit I/STV1